MLQTIQPVDFIDVSAMAAALVLRHSVHFADDERRQNFPGSPHHDTRCIVLRGPSDAGPQNWQEDVPHFDMPVLDGWPTARQVIEAISESHSKRAGAAPIFGKIMVVGLKVGGIVDWHVDEGPYAECHDRFHLPLIYSPGARIYSGADGAILPPGQLTWINNRIPHSAVNMGPVERVHMIVDIRKPEAVN